MSLIRPQKPLILVAFISSLILFSTAGNAALETKGPPSEQTPDKQLSYTFAELRIEFPSIFWQLVGGSEEEKRISFVRRYTIGFSNSFGILLVDVHPMARGFTREQHIKEYFNYERFKSRQGSEWSGFVEGTREIDGVHYPIMRYSVKANGSQSDGLFMILFPDDLEKRHRFYVLMLAENHPEGKPAPGFPDLESIVKNLKILPVLVSSDSIGVFELHYDPGDDTGAPLYLDDQPPTMAIARELAAAGKEHIIVWSSCPGEDTRSEHGVYVFYNNPVPYCYTYKIPGEWAFIPELNGYQSKGGATFVGVIPSYAAEYDDLEGATLIQRVRNKIDKQYEAHYGLQFSGVELEAFESDRRGTWKWQAAAIRQDGRLILPTPKYIVESSPEAIFQITVEGAPDNEELVRQIIKSLKTTSAPDCYFPLLERTLKTMEDLQCVHRDGMD